MMRFADCRLDHITELRRRIEEDLKSCTCLQNASQRLVNILYDEFRKSTVLVRVFATIAFDSLPERDQQFVVRLSETRRCRGELQDKTQVISLLGTRGKAVDWNERYRSSDRLAIPVLSASFIKTIPLVTRLLCEARTGVDWIQKQTARILVKSFGQMAQLVYVHDAGSDLTGDGFKVVASQDFVAAHDVRTVFGLGGSYLNRTFVAILFFTNEHIPQQQVEKFLPLINTFKTTTTAHAMGGRFFDD